MKLIKALIAPMLALSLMGAAAPAPASIDPHNGPACYGFNGWYHVWNLFAPQDVIAVDSCVAAQLIATRNLAGNYATYVAIAAARVPFLFPVSLYAMAWQTGNQALQTCASKGTGVEFVQDSSTGMILGCHAQ
jgi:hypothetical protein